MLLGGMINSLKRITTRKGDPMAFVNLEDLTGTIEIVVFPKTYELVKSLLTVDAAVLIKGKATGTDEDLKIICEEMSPMESHEPKELHLNLDSDSARMDQVQLMLQRYPGKTPVFFHLKKNKKVFRAGEDFWVDLSKPILPGLADLLGAANVSLAKAKREGFVESVPVQNKKKRRLPYLLEL